ncbi:hypothetical protein N5K28_004655 [Vibrio parahaemolyticus]|nr:hypothetical protein [Vibrio parahaemolyticus]EJU8948859.1 hypothetical protein [Vibrio parahaemolyticus]
MRNFISKVKNGALVLGASVASSSAFAIDVTAATSTITTDGTTAVTAIGGAMLGLCAVAVVIKYAKASIFG